MEYMKISSWAPVNCACCLYTLPVWCMYFKRILIQYLEVVFVLYKNSKYYFKKLSVYIECIGDWRRNSKTAKILNMFKWHICKYIIIHIYHVAYIWPNWRRCLFQNTTIILVDIFFIRQPSAPFQYVLQAYVYIQ